MTGFIGEEVPVFDIVDYYLPHDTQNMLVRIDRFGDALADCMPMNDAGLVKDWPFWAAQVQAHSLYKNDLT